MEGAGRLLASEEVAPGAHRPASLGPVSVPPEQEAGGVWELCWVLGEWKSREMGDYPRKAPRAPGLGSHVTEDLVLLTPV